MTHADRYKTNPEYRAKKLAYARQYYLDHTEQVKERVRAWSDAHQEAKNAYARAWRLRHPGYSQTEAHRAGARRYKKKHPETWAYMWAKPTPEAIAEAWPCSAWTPKGWTCEFLPPMQHDCTRSS